MALGLFLPPVASTVCIQDIRRREIVGEDLALCGFRSLDSPRGYKPPNIVSKLVPRLCGGRLLQRVGVGDGVEPTEDDHIRLGEGAIARTEEIEVVEGALQRANIAVEQRFGGNDIDGRHAVRR